jgi:FrmR/RcnR family transcriptional regulator, repressor of frmRAB operon
MPDTSLRETERRKLLNRVRRIRGQVEAIERGIDEDATCLTVLQRILGCRGALESLMAEVLEDHIRAHLFEDDGGTAESRKKAAEDLIEIVHSYLR